MRRQIEVSNEVAAALSGSGDEILRALEAHVDCDLFLRGNLVTLDGDAEPVGRRGDGRARARRAHRAGPRDRPGHDPRGHARARPARVARREVLEDVVWRHRSRKVAPKTVNQKRYVDSIRDNTITFGIGPAGTGKTFLAVAMAAAALTPPRGQPHHPHPPGRRGRRAPGLPARRPDGEDRPVPAAAVRRAARHARPREGRGLPGEGRHRGRAAGLHARPDAQRLASSSSTRRRTRRPSR